MSTGSGRFRRRALLPLLSGALLLASCSTGPASRTAPGTAGTAPDGRPNIVFVLTDDLSSNLVPYLPHVQALQRAGMSFPNYTVTDSLCCPSRSSIFSGRFPHNTGVFTNTGADGGFNVFHTRGEENSTFATALQKAGYHTAMMGKYLNGYQPDDTLGGPTPYVPPGWNEWDVAGNGYPEFDYDLNENGRVVHYGSDPSAYLTDVLAGKATAFISSAAHARDPFMLEVATFAPHRPYTPAPRDQNALLGLTAPHGPAFDTPPTNPPGWLASRTPLTARQLDRINAGFRKRAQSVQAVDQMLAAIENTLAATGQASNTVVVFSSDNGYHMGDYRLTWGKMTAFDTDVRVPLVVAGPGIPAGASDPATTRNIDLCPTFEELAGATVPADVDGRSLVPLLHGRQPPDWATAALVEHHGPDVDPADPDHPGRHSGNPPSYAALRTAHDTYVEYDNGEREYYDRDADPDQLHNIAASLPAATLTKLHGTLSALRGCRGQGACTAASR